MGIRMEIEAAGLRTIVGGAERVEAVGNTVAQVIADVARRHAGFARALLTADGEVQSQVRVCVGDAEVTGPADLKARIRPSEVVRVQPR